MEPVTEIFARLDRELWLVTAAAGARRGGLIATFVSQASIVPELPRVIAGIARQHYTWELIEASGRFILHLLGEEHLDWVWRFGLSSSGHGVPPGAGREGDKFTGLEVRASASGIPLLAGALAWLECRVEARFDTGDRTVYLAEVVHGEQVRLTPPLTTKRLLQLAPADKLAMLKDQLARDGAVDAAAIRAWRQRFHA